MKLMFFVVFLILSANGATKNRCQKLHKRASEHCEGLSKDIEIIDFRSERKCLNLVFKLKELSCPEVPSLKPYDPIRAIVCAKVNAKRCASEKGFWNRHCKTECDAITSNAKPLMARKDCVDGVATTTASCTCYKTYCQPDGYVCTKGRHSSFGGDYGDCVKQNTPKFKCMTREKWTEQKMAWCCANEEKGCPQLMLRKVLEEEAFEFKHIGYGWCRPGEKKCKAKTDSACRTNAISIVKEAESGAFGEGESLAEIKEFCEGECLATEGCLAIGVKIKKSEKTRTCVLYGSVKSKAGFKDSAQIYTSVGDYSKSFSATSVTECLVKVKEGGLVNPPTEPAKILNKPAAAPLPPNFDPALLPAVTNPLGLLARLLEEEVSGKKPDGSYCVLTKEQQRGSRPTRSSTFPHIGMSLSSLAKSGRTVDGECCARDMLSYSRTSGKVKCCKYGRSKRDPRTLEYTCKESPLNRLVVLINQDPSSGKIYSRDAISHYTGTYVSSLDKFRSKNGNITPGSIGELFMNYNQDGVKTENSDEITNVLLSLEKMFHKSTGKSTNGITCSDIRDRRDGCVSGERMITYKEISRCQKTICDLINKWAIVTGDGASMDGSAYGCKVESKPRITTHEMCVAK